MESYKRVYCPYCDYYIRLKAEKIDYVLPKFYYDKSWNEHLHDSSTHIDRWECLKCGARGRRSFTKKCPSCRFGGKVRIEKF